MITKQRTVTQIEHTRQLCLMNKNRKIGPMSEEHKRKIGIANRGKVRSLEHKKKNSDSHKGRPAPIHTRE